MSEEQLKQVEDTVVEAVNEDIKEARTPIPTEAVVTNEAPEASIKSEPQIVYVRKEPFSKRYPNAWRYILTGVVAFLAGSTFVVLGTRIAMNNHRNNMNDRRQTVQIERSSRNQDRDAESGSQSLPGSESTPSKTTPSTSTTTTQSN